MKRTFLALAGTALAATLYSPAALAETRLRVADSFPTSHFISVQGARFFMDAATRLSGGDLQFDYFPTQQLGTASDMLAITASGVTDIAYVVPAYASDLMPLSSVFELPAMFTSSCQGTRAYWSQIIEGGILNTTDFAPNGVVPMFGFALPPYQISTTAQPLDSLDRLEGQKIRAAGSAFELALRTLGAVPVRMAAPEIRESLVRGTIDGTVGPAVSLAPYDLLTVLRHMTQGASFGGLVATYSINAEVFAGLTESQQAALRAAGEETMAHFCAFADDNEAAAAQAFVAAGGTLYPYDAAMNAEIGDRLAPVAEEWATRLEGRNLPARSALEAARAALAAN